MKTIITVVVVLAFVLLFIWPGVWTGGVPVWTWMTGETTAQFFRPPSFQQQNPAAAPFVFNIESCDPYSSVTGFPLNGTMSLSTESCYYSAPTAVAPATPPPAAPVAPAASAPVAPAAQPTVEAGFSLKQGDVRDVHAGWGCFGDLDLWTGSEWYSPYLYEVDLDNTGQIVIFSADSKVKAAFPGSCTPWGNLDSMSNALRQTGCNNGCTDVNPVYWPK